MKHNPKNIFVWWYEEKTVKNFGDVLNPYLISKLSGLNVIRLIILDTPCRSFFRGIKNMFLLRITVCDFFNILRSYFQKYIVVAIGSIIEYYRSNKVKVWGSGLINYNNYIYPADFRAVRGEYTRNRLIELGYSPPDVIGDPALLLPLVYKPESVKKYKLGIIPHYLNYDEAIDVFKNNDNIFIINVYDNIEKIVDDINSCECTVSSSLHGIIVSHAYGIKSIWGNFHINKIGGDNVKYKDYFSSVKIECYDPVEITNDCDKLLNYFDSYTTLPLVDLRLIQKSLIEVAPFDVLDKFKSCFRS
jgi:hypothetical protein